MSAFPFIIAEEAGAEDLAKDIRTLVINHTQYVGFDLLAALTAGSQEHLSRALEADVVASLFAECLRVVDQTLPYFYWDQLKELCRSRSACISGLNEAQQRGLDDIRRRVVPQILQSADWLSIIKWGPPSTYKHRQVSHSTRRRYNNRDMESGCHILSFFCVHFFRKLSQKFFLRWKLNANALRLEGDLAMSRQGTHTAKEAVQRAHHQMEGLEAKCRQLELDHAGSIDRLQQSHRQHLINAVQQADDKLVCEIMLRSALSTWRLSITRASHKNIQAELGDHERLVATSRWRLQACACRLFDSFSRKSSANQVRKALAHWSRKTLVCRVWEVQMRCLGQVFKNFWKTKISLFFSWWQLLLVEHREAPVETENAWLRRPQSPVTNSQRRMLDEAFFRWVYFSSL